MKFNRYYILVFLLALAILSGCEDPTSGVRFDADVYYVLNGKLRANTPINRNEPIYLGKAVDADGGYFPDSYITDALVKMYNVTDPENITFVCTLYFAPPSNNGYMGYIDPYASSLPLPGQTYKIEAIIENDEFNRLDTIWAETTIPSPVEIYEDDVFTTDIPQSDADFPVLSWETANTDHPLTVITDNDEEHQLYYYYDCLEDYNWQLTRKVNPVYGESEYPEDADDYFDYDNIDYAYYYMPSFNEEIGEYVIMDRSYTNNLYFVGRYAITICSIDDNYFTYLYHDEGFMFGGVQTTNPNVVAFGYLGSISGQTAYTRVID